MDAYVDSCYLGSAFTILRNYLRSRGTTIKYLETLVKVKTGHDADAFPEITAKLSAAKKHMSAVESKMAESEIKALDHDIIVDIESAKELIYRLTTTTPTSPMAEVLVSVSNEDSERVVARRQSRPRSPASPKRVSFSPKVLSTHFYDHPEPVTESADPPVPIQVTLSSPKDSELDCLMCEQRFLKHQSLIEHLQSQHKMLVRMHDLMFETLTSENAADFCCMSCGSTFGTRKLAFRHSRDVHTNNYNNFIKLMAMTGSLKQYRVFFAHLDRETGDEPVLKSGLASTTSGGSGTKSRRRPSRLTHDTNAPTKRLSAPLTNSPVAASTPRPPIGPKAAHSKTGLSASFSDQSVSPAGDTSLKKGRSRPETKQPLEKEVQHPVASKMDKGLIVSDVEVAVPIRDLKGRKPVRCSDAGATKLSSPLNSELDSSDPSSAPPKPASCLKCKQDFVNAFELEFHQLKDCMARKPAGLIGRTTRFAMKSTKPNLDPKQAKLLNLYRSANTTPIVQPNFEDAPSSSGVQINMTPDNSPLKSKHSQESLKRKLDEMDDETENEAEEGRVSPSKLSPRKVKELIAACTRTSLSVVLDPMNEQEVVSCRKLLNFDP